MCVCLCVCVCVCVSRGMCADLLPYTSSGGTETIVLSLNGSPESTTPGDKQHEVGRIREKRLEDVLKSVSEELWKLWQSLDLLL